MDFDRRDFSGVNKVAKENTGHMQLHLKFKQITLQYENF